MLKRLYIDNYKCCTNFELQLDSINLLLGANGVGKSTIFEVLRTLRLFAGLGGKTDICFAAHTLTNWQTARTQTFEVELAGNGGNYNYQLSIDFDKNDYPSVKQEILRFDHLVLVQFESGNVDLLQGNFSYPLDSSQSAVALLPYSKNYEQINWFRDYLAKLIAVQINPNVMDSRSEREEVLLNANSNNFVSWYRHLYLNQGLAIQISQQLSDVLEGFKHFEFVRLGETWQGLNVSFASSSNGRKSIAYPFHQLSDGQRALIVLYTLVAYASSSGATLCIDEPENFLALPEIQPWLVNLFDLCKEGQFQSLLISHHPELINYLAASNGIWFSRESNGPSRIKRIADEAESGIPIAELVARGWIHG